MPIPISSQISFYGKEFSPGYAKVIVKALGSTENLKNVGYVNEELNYMFFSNRNIAAVEIVESSFITELLGEKFLGGILKRSIPKVKINNAKHLGFTRVGNSKIWRKDGQIYEEEGEYLVPSTKDEFSLKKLLKTANSKYLSSTHRKMFGSDPAMPQSVLSSSITEPKIYVYKPKGDVFMLKEEFETIDSSKQIHYIDVFV